MTSDHYPSLKAPLLANYRPTLELRASKEAPALPPRSESSSLPHLSRWRFLLGFLCGAVVILSLQAIFATSFWDYNVLRSDPDPRFPPFESVGPHGPTATGNEAYLLATSTAQPQLEHHFPLTSIYGNSTAFWHNLAHLSPQYTVPSFGLPDASPVIPQDYELTQVHILHRHGARYATSGNSLTSLAQEIEDARPNGMNASGDLAFLNDWTYQMGSDILTPFGRSQLFNLGVKFRFEYGHLLKHLKRPPVFRSTTQDRMVKSALNFAAGFWGIPYEDQYHQLYIIEQAGYNNSLDAEANCPNSDRPMAFTGYSAFYNFTQFAFVDTAARLQTMVEGFTITPRRAVQFLDLCAYETVSLGYSAFCPLFTLEDFEAYEYAHDLMFLYGHGPGSPLSTALGAGWVEELISRLTQERIYTSRSAINATLDSDPIYFPLDQSIYVDATHDTTISVILTALNLTLTDELLPMDHIKHNRTYVVSRIVPFASNLVVQVVKHKTLGEKAVRFILNDGVVPASSIDGCPYDKNGFCALDAFVTAMRRQVATADWDYACTAH